MRWFAYAMLGKVFLEDKHTADFSFMHNLQLCRTGDISWIETMVLLCLVCLLLSAVVNVWLCASVCQQSNQIFAHYLITIIEYGGGCTAKQSKNETLAHMHAFGQNTCTHAHNVSIYNSWQKCLNNYWHFASEWRARSAGGKSKRVSETIKLTFNKLMDPEMVR